jgi:hypothetical protein
MYEDHDYLLAYQTSLLAESIVGVTQVQLSAAESMQGMLEELVL